MKQIELQELLLELWNHEVDVDYVLQKLNSIPSASNNGNTIVTGALPYPCVDPLFEIKGCDMPKGSCSSCGGNDR